jgi:hypothetical protein
MAGGTLSRIREQTPRVVKATLRRTRRSARRATIGLRAKPDFLYIGGARCGSTSMWEYLSAHPQVIPAKHKQLLYYDAQHDRGLDWYRSNFPFRIELGLGSRPKITGEATTSYLFNPVTPERVAVDLPRAKLLVQLREPVARVFSHYRLNLKLGEETRSFAEVVASERLDFVPLADRIRAGDPEAIEETRARSIVARGFYAEQLERWFRYFPREQFLITRSEDLFERPAEVYARTLQFLGLEPFDGVEFTVHNASDQGVLDEPTRTWLEELYEPHNRRLVELLGPELSWPAPGA